jgi:large subunit ribosomal protein L21
VVEDRKMVAIVELGSHQYRVSQGDVLEVELLDKEPGEQVSLSNVVALVGEEGELKVGRPYVDGAQVKATVMEHGRGRKIVVMKFKKRKNYRRKQGHRQWYTRLLIDEIVA